MYDQRSEAGERLPDTDDVAGVVFGLYPTVRRFSGLRSSCASSLACAIDAPARVLVEDGLAQLLASGLAHRLEEFVFATHAATRAREWTR
jgi:hypothetical protein